MSSDAAYQRIPTSSPSPPPSAAPSQRSRPPVDRPQEASTREAFAQRPPAAWKRIALVLGLIGMFWLAIRLGRGAGKPQVIYASRYSDEHKYRPAASPIITETLADGRIRIRGASPAGVGIQPGDLPKTPREVARERKEREKAALEEAKRQLGIGKRKRRAKGNMQGGDEI